MKDIHAQSIKAFTAEIGMAGLGFDNNQMLSFAINEQLQIVLHNHDDGVIFIAPMPQFHHNETTAWQLLQWNNDLKNLGNYGYFSYNNIDKIVIYQSLIHSHQCQNADHLQAELLRQIQLCEQFLKLPPRDDTGDLSMLRPLQDFA